MTDSKIVMGLWGILVHNLFFSVLFVSNYFDPYFELRQYINMFYIVSVVQMKFFLPVMQYLIFNDFDYWVLSCSITNGDIYGTFRSSYLLSMRVYISLYMYLYLLKYGHRKIIVQEITYQQ